MYKWPPKKIIKKKKNEKSVTFFNDYDHHIQLQYKYDTFFL